MKKRILSFLIVIALLVTCAAACTKPDGPDTVPTPAPVATDAPKDTEAPEKPTDAPAAEPTEVPTEEPTKEPKPELDIGDLDCILFDLEDESSMTTLACLFETGVEDIWLDIETDIGDNYVVFNFDEPFSGETYKYIAFKYRLGYAQSIRNTNHFYSVNTESGGPSGTEGLWGDIEWISDQDWHTGILNLAEMFPAAAGDWTAIRFPSVDAKGGIYSIAWLGAFKSEEDIQKYDDAFNKVYGEKLVKAEAPAEQDKDEEIPDLDDEFDETLFDFEEFDNDESFTPGSFDPYEYKMGANQSRALITDNNAYACLAFDTIYYNGLIKSEQGYTATFRFRNNGDAHNFGGFVFNWGDENNTSRDFFENNGLEGDGMGSLVSNSGCGFFFQGNNTVKIYVPCWDAEKNKKSYASATIEADINFSGAFVDFEVVDDGTGSVTVKANGNVFVVLEYSNPGVINKAFGYNEGYYRNVKLVDGAGNELFSAENALFSKYKSFAWAGRAHEVYVDDIKIVNKK
ncbi:MAG: PT domain-containing protein [Clostridia bacterium]|nr:PT domain-containing protein [Clostridia bacterium]